MRKSCKSMKKYEKDMEKVYEEIYESKRKIS